jgi:hypothetical protein
MWVDFGSGNGFGNNECIDKRGKYWWVVELTMFYFSEICKFLCFMHVIIVSYEGRAFMFKDGMQL